MNTTNFQRIILFFMLAALLIPFSGCQTVSPETDSTAASNTSVYTGQWLEAGQPLTVCIDAAFQESAKNLVSALKEVQSGAPQVEWVVIPKDAALAEAKIAEIRTQIMTGGGPDLFLVRCTDPNWSETVPVLFPNPEKTMYSHVFLPLDGLLASAQYANPEALNQTLLASGKTEEGQMLLPIAYTYYLTAYHTADLNDPDNIPVTWQELTECQEPAVLQTFSSVLFMTFFNAFGSLADYSQEMPAISEAELLSRVKEGVSITKKGWESSDAPEAIAYGFLDYPLLRKLNRQEENTLCPLGNADGGITANVTMFAAINRNTEQPENAFSLLDLLLSDEIVRGSGFVGITDGTEKWVDFTLTARGVSINDVLLQEQCGLSDADFAALQSLTSQITAVRFWSDFDSELLKMYSNCRFAENETAMQAVISQTYDALQMALAE